jgi:hypothetical protein
MTTPVGSTGSTRLVHRVAKVTIITPSDKPNAYFSQQGGKQNAIEVTDLRIKFSIESSVKTDPNKCELEIFNLAEATRALCETKPLIVWIDAGYDGALRQIFSGDVRRAFSKLEKPEWITKISLADGDRAMRTARANRTYAGGTPTLRIVQDLVGQLGLSVDPAQVAKISGLNTQVLGARAVQGNAAAELTRVLSPLGVEWSIQNGKFTMLRDQDIVDGQAFVVQQDTGLIGTPEYTTPVTDTKPAQLKLRMLLYPQLSPGKLIKVTSRDINGRTFRIQKVVHKGDTHGQDWFSDIEALPANPSGNS